MPITDTSTLYLRDLSYDAMMFALGTGVSDSEIVMPAPGGTIPASVDTIIKVQDHLLNELDDIGQYDTITYVKTFKYVFDKALTYRLAGRRDSTIDHLNDIKTWAWDEDTSMLNYWTCVCEFEQDIIDSTISMEDADSLFDCEYPLEDIPSFLQKRHTIIDPFRKSISDEYVKIFPNPSQNYSSVILKLNAESRVTIKVMDLQGKVLMTPVDNTFTKGTHQVRINNTSLESGSYILQVIRGKEVGNFKYTVLK